MALLLGGMLSYAKFQPDHTSGSRYMTALSYFKGSHHEWQCPVPSHHSQAGTVSPSSENKILPLSV